MEKKIFFLLRLLYHELCSWYVLVIFLCVVPPCSVPKWKKNNEPTGAAVLWNPSSDRASGWFVSHFFILVLNKGGTGEKSPGISPISYWFLFRANDSETDLFYLSHWFLLTAAESETGTDLCFSPPSHPVAAINQECSHTTGKKWSAVCFEFLDEMSPWNYIKTVGGSMISACSRNDTRTKGASLFWGP